jgi:hypothetical protein
VYFVLLAAAVAILACVVAVAMGWGGEMTESRRDLPARGLRARTAAEVAMLRLPASAFGYQREATDEALHAIAGLIAERDAEIAGLRQELWRLRGQLAAGEAAQLQAAAPDAEPEPHEAEPEPPASESAGLAAGEVLSGHGQAAGPQPPS